jgi:DNA-binding FadR family transcriptional regulator
MNDNFHLTVVIPYLYADKPEWLTPLANLIVIELLLVSRITKEMQTKPAHSYLCDKLNVWDQAVRDALALLFEHGWVVKVRSGKSSGDSNTYAVQISMLPVPHKIKRELSSDAYNIAQRYFTLAKALPKRTSRTGRQYVSYRTQAGWLQRWQFLAQGWLDKGHTKEQIDRAVDAFFQHRPEDARHGMQALKRHFANMLEASKPVLMEIPMEVPVI